MATTNTSAPIDTYLPVTTYNQLIDSLMTPAPHFDRRTQLVELLGNAGVWPMSCLADHDAEELAQRDMDAILRLIDRPLPEADWAAMEAYRKMLIENYQTQIDLAKTDKEDAE